MPISVSSTMITIRLSLASVHSSTRFLCCFVDVQGIILLLDEKDWCCPKIDSFNVLHDQNFSCAEIRSEKFLRENKTKQLDLPLQAISVSEGQNFVSLNSRSSESQWEMPVQFAFQWLFLNRLRQNKKKISFNQILQIFLESKYFSCQLCLDPVFCQLFEEICSSFRCLKSITQIFHLKFGRYCQNLDGPLGIEIYNLKWLISNETIYKFCLMIHKS